MSLERERERERERDRETRERQPKTTTAPRFLLKDKIGSALGSSFHMETHPPPYLQAHMDG